MQTGFRWEHTPRNGHSTINWLIDGHRHEMEALFGWINSIDWMEERVPNPQMEVFQDPVTYRARLDPVHLVILYEDITFGDQTQGKIQGFSQLVSATNWTASSMIESVGFYAWVKECEVAARVRSRHRP